MGALLSLDQTLVYTSLSRSSVYHRINPKSKHYDPKFPKPCKLGLRRLGFLREELDTWIEDRAAARAA